MHAKVLVNLIYRVGGQRFLSAGELCLVNSCGFDLVNITCLYLVFLSQLPRFIINIFKTRLKQIKTGGHNRFIYIYELKQI